MNLRCLLLSTYLTLHWDLVMDLELKSEFRTTYRYFIMHDARRLTTPKHSNPEISICSLMTEFLSPMRKNEYLHIFLLLLLLLPSLSSASSNATDRESLLSFKSLISDPLGHLSSWTTNGTLPLCQWPGVACSSSRHPERVTSLNLDSLNLAGTLSPSLSNLTFLHTLSLPNNRLSGTIPPELGRLSRLQVLVLSNNSISGSIPANLSRCQSLKDLILDTNTLAGQIPTELGSLSGLIKLELYTNNLAGDIPPALGNLSSLTGLDLSENSLTGRIPESLSRLSSLGFLQLSINNLSGELHPSLFNSSTVYYFDVGSNQLHGELPSDIGSRLPNLLKLYFYSNMLEGQIPSSISNASKLERLGLEVNQFNGVVPSELGRRGTLSWLALGHNQLEASTASDWDFLNSLTNCSNLEILEFSNNLFSGDLPSSIANLSTKLEWISIEDNQISGAIPNEMGRYVNLTFLSMFNNVLSGAVPTSIGRLQNLNVLRLFGNRLSGEIPSSLGNLTQLNELNLGDNAFEGGIPGSLGGLTSLNLLNVSCNKLTGPIPREIGSLSSLTIYLDLSHNSLIGLLPAEVGNLKNLLGLDISENRLSGVIPSALGGCQVLVYLYLERNLLQGTIPPSLSSLKGVQELDVSSNNLSGPIPQFLDSFQYLKYLNLSFNDFEGEVPTGGIFGNETAVSLTGNARLCGVAQGLHLQECYIGKNKHMSTASIAIIIAGGILCLILLFGLLVLIYWMKISKKRSLSRTDSADYYSRVSYAELVKATDGFSPENLIGSGSYGSVYKGILDSDEKIVAVKVLNLQRLGASKSFKAECEALRNSRHRNLVRILTTCVSIDSEGNDFKAIVLEFMPNGSLEDWLHSETGQTGQSRKLSFVQRLNIAVDVASALDYLHHYGYTPIVHCDLKPSNILLDADIVAHVSDFGLARALAPKEARFSENLVSSMLIKGTIGYVAPEYGIGSQVSTCGDVYSYGILLLEIFTGRRPTDEIFNDGFSLHKYVEMALPDHLRDIVDPDLLYEDDWGKIDEDDTNTTNSTGSMLQCLASVFAIALSCSEESPRGRREMGTVIKEMLTLREKFLSKMLLNSTEQKFLTFWSKCHLTKMSSRNHITVILDPRTPGSNFTFMEFISKV